MKNLLVLCGVCLAAGLLATTARAYTTTGTILVSVTVPKACTFSTSNLAFGIYSSTALAATASIAVTCTSTTAYYINFNNGLQSSCCWTNNMKSSGGANLNYALYQDSAHTKVWNNTVYLDGVAGIGTGAPQSLLVYGLTYGGQYVAAGAYTDTVTATITY